MSIIRQQQRQTSIQTCIANCQVGIGRTSILTTMLFGALLVSFGGCNSKPTKIRVIAAPHFHTFDNVESIQLTIRKTDQEITCEIPKALLSKFRSAFANAVEEPEPAKWEVNGKVRYHTDGKEIEALLLIIDHDEGGLRVSINEYWRNIDLNIIQEVARDCEKTI